MTTLMLNTTKQTSIECKIVQEIADITSINTLKVIEEGEKSSLILES